MNKNIFLLVALVLLFTTCQKPVQKWLLKVDDISFEKKEEVPAKYSAQADCNNSMYYIPDTSHVSHTIMRYIRVNVHFMNRADSTKNFDGVKAVAFAKSLLAAAEQDLVKRNKLAIPPRNTIPALPKRYRYELTPLPNKANDQGVYCHYDNELFYFLNKGRHRNNSKKEVLKKYAIQEDSVLNIFIMPHHPDSVKSKKYHVSRTGIALGNSIKIAGIYESGIHDPREFKGLLNHEIGHVLGLSHAWGYDGCDDTPVHPNCWNITKEAPCDTMTSNNVMDYNAFQHAWTPCQIGKIHKNFARLKSRQRKLLIPNWCSLDEKKSIIISDNIEWKAAKDIQNHIIIEDKGVLKLSCRLSLPKGAKIIVKPGGHLILENAWLHNACGDNWTGIEIQESGNKKGNVTIIGNTKIDDCSFILPK